MRIVAIFLFIIASVFSANAQAYINVVTSPAGCIVDGSGATITSGTMTIVGTNELNKAIPYRAGNSNAVITAPITRTITNGSLATTLQLADPSQSLPLNILYHFTIKDNVTLRTTDYILIVIEPNETKIVDVYTEFNFCKMNPAPLTPQILYTEVPLTFSGDTTLNGDFTINGDLNSDSLNNIRFARTGATTAIRATTACSSLSGARGLVVIPTDAPTGSLDPLPENCQLWDLRGVTGQGSTGQYGGYSKDVNFFQRFTTAPSAAVSNQQTLHVVGESAQGGYQQSGGPKTNYTTIYAHHIGRTIGQHTAVNADAYAFGDGDNVGIFATATSSGSQSEGGDEGNEAARLSTIQGYYVASGTIPALGVTGNVITLGGSFTGYFSLGEHRPLINTSTGVITAGTITSIDQSGNVIGSGTAFNTLCPASTAPCTLGTGGTALDATRTTTRYFSLDSETHSTFKDVVAVLTVTDATHMRVGYKATTAIGTWNRVTNSGAYHIYKGSQVTSVSDVNTGTTITVTVRDGTQFAAGNTFEQPLGAGYGGTGIKLLLNQYTGNVDSQTGIEVANMGTIRADSVTQITGDFNYGWRQFSGHINSLFQIQGTTNPGAIITLAGTANTYTSLFAMARNSGTGYIAFDKQNDTVAIGSSGATASNNSFVTSFAAARNSIGYPIPQAAGLFIQPGGTDEGLRITANATGVFFTGLSSVSAPRYSFTDANANFIDVNLNVKTGGTIKFSVAPATGNTAIQGTLAVGASGTGIVQVRKYTPSLTPFSVPTITCTEQTFTVTGLSTSDVVVVNGPAPNPGVTSTSWRVSATDTLAGNFCNVTAGALTPTNGTYTVMATRF